MISQEARAQLKKEKALKRKNQMIDLQQRLLKVQREIELETKNESELKQKLQSLNSENTDTLGFTEFIGLLNILDGKKRMKSEVNAKILRYLAIISTMMMMKRRRRKEERSLFFLSKNIK